jgi:hypothetical protein
MKPEVFCYSCIVVVEGPFLKREIESIKCSPRTEGTKKELKKERKENSK